MQRVLSRVLPAIRPSADELAHEIGFAQMLVAHISDNAPKGCQVVLTGSVAKKTFLRDKRDIDIFVLFARSVPREALEPHIKDIMAASFPGLGYQLSYAEHPYSRFHFEGRRIDLVPAYKITKAAERISAVDRSVLHTEFVNSRLKKKNVDDVLLLKQFLRSNGIYGAEIKIEGFSGYLCELLIIRYGGFPGLLRAAAKWKGAAPAGIFIDIKKYYKPSEAKGAAKRFGSQLVVIDPTDKDRNVAAAVSESNLGLFISLCRAFLKKPSESLFFKKPETFEERTEKAAKGKKLILLSMPRPDIVDDILWGQLHKMIGQLETHLKEFEPKEIIADDSRHLVRLGIILGIDALPKTMLVAGPPIGMKKHAEQFRKSHKKGKFIIKKKKIYAEVKRPIAKAEDAIHSFFRGFAATRSHLAYPEEMLVVERPIPGPRPGKKR
jgi:tRNA nucleotidyltransferase (CCA-adding enzyme)